MKPKTKKLDAAICAEMFRWHKHQADCLEHKLKSKLSSGEPCRSGSPQLWEQYEIHRRFHHELEKLFSYAARDKMPRFA